MRCLSIWSAAGVALMLAGCWGDQGEPSGAPAAGEAAPAKSPEEARAEMMAKVYSRLGVSDGKSLSTRIDTSMGAIDCSLLPDIAPLTVLNFVGLAEGTQEWLDPKTGQKTTAPLYTGTTFHRVIPNFMIQGGDPKGNGTGGPGYKFRDEPHAEVTFAEPGKLAMANSGPNTNGSQFFITEGAPTHLNGKHTIFGVCDDLSVVKQIARVEAGPRNAPNEPVVINAIEIVRAGTNAGADAPDAGDGAAEAPADEG